MVQGIHYGQRTSAYALTHYGDLTRVSPSELNIPEYRHSALNLITAQTGDTLTCPPQQHPNNQL